MTMNKIKYKPRNEISNDPKVNLTEGGKVWAEYWRKNIEIFIEQYMGIKLFTFQKILIHILLLEKLCISTMKIGTAAAIRED